MSEPVLRSLADHLKAAGLLDYAEWTEEYRKTRSEKHELQKSNFKAATI